MDKNEEKKWVKTFGNIDTPASMMYGRDVNDEFACCVFIFAIFACLVVGVIGMTIGEYITYNDVRKDVCRTVYTTLVDYDKCIIEDIHNTVHKIVGAEGDL